MSSPRRRDVRLLAGSAGLSAAGDGVLWILLSFHVAAGAGSPPAVSAVFICLWGPVVALGGVAGRLVDRVENRRLLIGVALAQAAVVAAMAPAADCLPVLLGLCVLLGAGAALSSPAEFALLPAAAGEARLAAANGHMESARYLGMTAGPVAGGLLAAAGAIELGLLLDAASFLAVASAGLALRVRRAPVPAAPRAHEHVREGLGVLLAGDRILAVALPAAIAALLFFTVSVSAEVYFARDVLGTGAAGYGVLMAAWTLGMVGGAAGVARRVPRRALGAAALGGVALQGAGLLGAAAGATMALALAGLAVGGTAHGVKNVALRTLIHERVPAAMRGRAFAAYNAARNAAELAALGAGGVLVGALGARTALALSGAVPLLIAVVALLVLARRPALAPRTAQA